MMKWKKSDNFARCSCKDVLVKSDGEWIKTNQCTLVRVSELRSCVKVEVAVLGSASLIVRTVSVG